MSNIFSKHSKTLKVIAIGLGLLVVSAGVSVLLLKSFYKAPATKASDISNTAATISPTDLIKKYTDSSKLDGYTVDTSVGNSVLTYKLSDTSYTVQIFVRDNVQFAKTTNASASESTKAIDAGKAYLTSNNFNKVSEQIVPNATELTYDNKNTVCKIYSNFESIGKSATYGLICADKKAFSAERDSIKTLVDLYKQASGTVDFKDVVQTTHAEANKSLSLLSINPEDSAKAPYTLIFAAIDGKWSYIGSRITPSVDVKESFQLSSDLKAKINNSKYNGFIAKYVY